jgi:hypothetical protein
MKNIFSFLFLLVVASCTKVIDIKTKSSDAKVVIVGSLRDGSNTATVKISKSVDLNAVNTFPYVTGAVVTITDDAGGSFNLLESSTLGTYETMVVGVIGRTYTLTVLADGKTYTSVCKMENGTSLDDIYFFPFTGFGTGYGLIPLYNDEVGTRSYSRFIVYTNNILQPGIYIADDEFSDGLTQTQPIFGSYQSESGDSIRIEKQAIDEKVYKYLLDLGGVSNGGSDSASPANPKSNIDNGAFGYFSAYSSSSYRIKIP